VLLMNVKFVTCANVLRAAAASTEASLNRNCLSSTERGSSERKLQDDDDDDGDDDEKITVELIVDLLFVVS
jgi:hypothetical protein